MGFGGEMDLGWGGWEQVEMMVLWTGVVDTVREDFWGAVDDDDDNAGVKLEIGSTEAAGEVETESENLAGGG